MTELKRLTPVDFAQFHPLGDPQYSPDGERVAYVVTTVDLESSQYRTAIWVASPAGGPPRQVTHPSTGSDHSPRWSPDGRHLAFVSTRSGKPQLWVLPADGGEARCLATEQAPTSAPAWSPDGSQIAFTARVFDMPADWEPYPGAPAGDRQRAEAAAKADPKAKESKVSDVKVITRLQYRFDLIGYFGDRRQHLFVAPADGSGPACQVSTGDFDHNLPVWSADGQALFCTAFRGTDENARQMDVWRFAVATSEATLVYQNPGPIMAVAASRDGKYLALAANPSASNWAANLELLCVPLDGGQAVSLSGALDRPIGPATISDLRSPMLSILQWSADSATVYAPVGDRGETHLYAFPVAGGAPRHLVGDAEQTVTGFSVAPDGTAAVLLADSTTPDELYLLKGGDRRRLTDHNGAAREYTWVPAERFTFAGADGWPIDGWLIRPAGYEPGKRYPTVLEIHGGPHGAWGPAPWFHFQTLAAAGFAVVYTNPRGSQTYGESFAVACTGDWGGKDFQDIMAGVDAVIALGVADPDRLGVMGWSYGGFMTCWTVTQTSRFKAAITGAPVANRHSMIGTTDIPGLLEYSASGNPWTREGEERLLDRSPIRHVANVTTPVMLMAGEADLRCPISQAEEFYAALKRLAKVPTVFVRYPGDFHWPLAPRHAVDRFERSIAWFQHYL